jgi:hypothetical protein
MTDAAPMAHGMTMPGTGPMALTATGQMTFAVRH